LCAGLSVLIRRTRMADREVCHAASSQQQPASGLPIDRRRLACLSTELRSDQQIRSEDQIMREFQR
jgi:hypothetical protein